MAKEYTVHVRLIEEGRLVVSADSHQEALALAQERFRTEDDVKGDPSYGDDDFTVEVEVDQYEHL